MNILHYLVDLHEPMISDYDLFNYYCASVIFKVMLPANSDEIVLSSNCENSAVTVNKEHLKFSFIPSKMFFFCSKSVNVELAVEFFIG